MTHIVTATNNKGVCPRTLKYLNGVLTGKWIVKYQCKSMVQYINWKKLCWHVIHSVRKHLHMLHINLQCYSPPSLGHISGLYQACLLRKSTSEWAIWSYIRLQMYIINITILMFLLKRTPCFSVKIAFLGWLRRAFRELSLANDLKLAYCSIFNLNLSHSSSM